MNLRLDWCSQEAARYAVEKWHYSRFCPIGKQANVGVWESGKFIGCVHFRNGANKDMATPYGLTQWQCVELARVALNNHEAPVSRIVSIAVKMIHKVNPGLRLIVSYADPQQDHHGGIYQAMNWIYTGTTAGDREYFTDGKWRKARNFRSSQWSKFSGINLKTLRMRETPGKHRYLMPLDPQMRAEVLGLAKPYPKRGALPVPPAVGSG